MAPAGGSAPTDNPAYHSLCTQALAAAGAHATNCTNHLRYFSFPQALAAARVEAAQRDFQLLELQVGSIRGWYRRT